MPEQEPKEPEPTETAPGNPEPKATAPEVTALTEPEPEEPEPETPTPKEPEPETKARHPVASALLRFARPTLGQGAIAVALALVAMAIVVQVQSGSTTDRYSAMRRDDLVQLLDNLTQEQERLEAEVNELQRTRDALQSGADAQKVAEQEAQRRADGLAILAGTAPASGPGVRIVVSAPSGRISADLLLDAVQELRDAGAEVIEINDSIRLVAQSWVGEDSSGGLVIDDEPVSLPIVIDAIGDSHSLAEGMRFRGGLVSQVEGQKVGGSVSIDELDAVTITSLYDAPTPEYARPA